MMKEKVYHLSDIIDSSQETYLSSRPVTYLDIVFRPETDYNRVELTISHSNDNNDTEDIVFPVRPTDLIHIGESLILMAQSVLDFKADTKEL